MPIHDLLLPGGGTCGRPRATCGGTSARGGAYGGCTPERARRIHGSAPRNTGCAPRSGGATPVCATSSPVMACSTPFDVRGGPGRPKPAAIRPSQPVAVPGGAAEADDGIVDARLDLAEAHPVVE